MMRQLQILLCVFCSLVLLLLLFLTLRLGLLLDARRTDNPPVGRQAIDTVDTVEAWGAAANPIMYKM